MGSPVAPLVVGLGEILWDLLPAGKVLGGAPANFVHHAQALGARGIIVSAVGADPLGREILAQLEASGLSSDYLTTEAAHPTGTVTVTLSTDGAPRFIIHPDVAWDCQQFTPRLAQLARESSAVCFGTLAQRTPAAASMIRSFLDASGKDTLRVFDLNLRQEYYSREVILESLARTDVLKLNDEELPILEDLLRVGGSEREVMEELRGRWRLSLICLTRGARGSTLFGESGFSHRGPEAVRVVDSVGAGDAFTAAVVLGLLHRLPLEQIHRHASHLATYVCTQPGATPAVPPALRSAPVS